MAETLVEFNLDCLVDAPGILIGVRLTISVEFASKRSAVTGLLTLSQVSAIGKEIAGRIGPSACVDRGEARAAKHGAKSIGNIWRDIGSWSVVSVYAGRRKAQRHQCGSVSG